MKVQRNRACDESYRHFLNVAPSIRDEKSGEVEIGGITFLREFEDVKVPPDTMVPAFASVGRISATRSW
jgi:hypothetical protein